MEEIIMHNNSQCLGPLKKSLESTKTNINTGTNIIKGRILLYLNKKVPVLTNVLFNDINYYFLIRRLSPVITLGIFIDSISKIVGAISANFPLFFKSNLLSDDTSNKGTGNVV